MSNSKLVTYTRLSPHKNSPRNHVIDTITIHCIVGQWTAKQGCDYFATTDRDCSANYVVGKDGSVGLSVEEKDRSWCSSSGSNDNRAITIEVASDATHPYAVTDAAYKALVNLCVDICQRNGIKELKWKADKSLIGQVDKQNMTVHRWFANKACPGDYLYNRHGQIAAEVNARLGASSKPSGGGEVSTPVKDEKPVPGLAVGSVVTFTGTKHYISSMAVNGKSCKPGEAKVTAVAKSGKHPYHLIKTTGSSSTVYGWVDAADVKEVAPAIVKGSRVKVAKGAKTYNGGGLAPFVYTTIYTVIQIDGSRVVIGINGVVTAAVNIKDLTLVG